MHWYRHKLDGKERLWIDDEEFETFTERELQAAALYPTADRSAVDIERFIQRHMKAALDQHADLGDGIAGAIEFSQAQTKVLISRRLTELADEDGCPAGVRGRWRATMAHEAAHGLLHRRIFETDLTQILLFEITTVEIQEALRIIQCADSDINFGPGTYDWREYQANRGMAALLMPRRVFCEVAKAEMAFLTRAGQPLLPKSKEYDTLIKCLSQRFEVSRQAASIRLKAFEAIVGIGQRPLVSAQI